MEYLETRAKVRSELNRISPRHSVLRSLAHSAKRSGDYAVLWQIAIKYPILVANELGSQIEYEFANGGETSEELAQLFFRVKAYLPTQIYNKLKTQTKQTILHRAKVIHEHGLKSRTVSYKEYIPGAAWNFELTFEKMIATGERTPSYRSIVSPHKAKSRRSFVLMVDKSHSVYRYISQIAIAAAVLSMSLQKENYSVMAFDSSVHSIKQLNEPILAEHVVDQLFLLDAGGKTNLKKALEVGLTQFQKVPLGYKRVACLLSDLQPTEGGDPLSVAQEFDDLRILQAPVTETQGTNFQLTGKFARLNNVTLVKFSHHSDIPTLIQEMIYD